MKHILSTIAALMLLLAAVGFARDSCDFSELSFRRKVADSFDGQLKLTPEDSAELTRIWNQSEKSYSQKVKDTFLFYVDVRLRGLPKRVQDHVRLVLAKSQIESGVLDAPTRERLKSAVSSAYYDNGTERIVVDIDDSPYPGQQIVRYAAFAHELEHAIQHGLAKSVYAENGRDFETRDHLEKAQNLHNRFLSEKSAMGAEHALFHLIPGGSDMLRFEVETAAKQLRLPTDQYIEGVVLGQIPDAPGRPTSRNVGILYGLVQGEKNPRNYMRSQWASGRYSLWGERLNGIKDITARYKLTLQQHVNYCISLRQKSVPTEVVDREQQLVLDRLDSAITYLRDREQEVEDALEVHWKGSRKVPVQLPFARNFGSLVQRRALLLQALRKMEECRQEVEAGRPAVLPDLHFEVLVTP